MSRHGLAARLVMLAFCAWTSTAQATMYTVYNDTDPTYLGDGSELAAALVAPGSGIQLVAGSSSFQGNFDNSGSGGGTPTAAAVVIGDPSYGSAAFFSDLNFGELDGTSFTLGDGILLTSGLANLPNNNTQSGFTGQASGLGDQGLDNLLSTLPGSHFSADATVLSFDFNADPGVNAVRLDILFGTDEYSEFVDDYPEIAAVFVDGVNYAGFSDGSLLTLTGATVGGGNFFNNDIFDGGAPVGTSGESPLAVEYDGVSAPLNVIGLLDPGLTTHNIKIAVSDTNDQALDTGLFASNLRGATLVGGTDPSNPLLPVPTPGEPGFEFVIDVGDTGVGIDPSFPIFIDPYVATGYTYEAFGANFATVLIPVAVGDGIYNLYIWDGSDYVFVQTIDAGVQFNLLDLDPLGFSKFMIDGIELDAALDPLDPLAFVTGVTFTNGGTISVIQTAIATCDGSADCAGVAAAPTPLMLLTLGMLGVMVTARRRV